MGKASSFCMLHPAASVFIAPERLTASSSRPCSCRTCTNSCLEEAAGSGMAEADEVAVADEDESAVELDRWRREMLARSACSAGASSRCGGTATIREAHKFPQRWASSSARAYALAASIGRVGVVEGLSASAGVTAVRSQSKRSTPPAEQRHVVHHPTRLATRLVAGTSQRCAARNCCSMQPSHSAAVARWRCAEGKWGIAR